MEPLPGESEIENKLISTLNLAVVVELKKILEIKMRLETMALFLWVVKTV